MRKVHILNIYRYRDICIYFNEYLLLIISKETSVYVTSVPNVDNLVIIGRTCNVIQ